MAEELGMFLVEDNELLEYEVGGAVFRYQRLVHSRLKQLRYLAQIRGNFDDDLFDKMCAAVGLRTWEKVRRTDGYVPCPLELPASAISDVDQQTVARFAALVPMSQTELRKLHGAFYVVDRIPSTNAVVELASRMREYAPEALEKKWQLLFNGASSLEIPIPAMCSIALTADGTSEVSYPVIAEG